MQVRRPSLRDRVADDRADDDPYGRHSRAGADTRLCSGYDECRAGGYSDADYGSNSMNPYWNMVAGHNCTNYVAYRLVRAGLPNVRPPADPGRQNNHLDAWQWGEVYASRTDATPTSGSVAWWAADAGKGAIGHVAWVESVNPDGSVTISEDSSSGHDFDWKTIPPGHGWPTVSPLRRRRPGRGLAAGRPADAAGRTHAAGRTDAAGRTSPPSPVLAAGRRAAARGRPGRASGRRTCSTRSAGPTRRDASPSAPAARRAAARGMFRRHGRCGVPRLWCRFRGAQQPALLNVAPRGRIVRAHRGRRAAFCRRTGHCPATQGGGGGAAALTRARGLTARQSPIGRAVWDAPLSVCPEVFCGASSSRSITV